MLYDVTFINNGTPVRCIKNLVADSKEQAFDYAERLYNFCRWEFSYSDMIAEVQPL